MKRNFELILIGVDGDPIINADKVDAAGKKVEPNTPVRLRDVAYAVLTASFHDEQQSLSGDDKYKRYELLGRILKAGKRGESTEVTPEEISLVKKLVAKLYGPGIVGPVYDLLNADPGPQTLPVPELLDHRV